MDDNTRREIRKVTAETLRDAGLTEPPLSVDRLLEHMELYRDYYDLSDPGFLEQAKHKLLVHGRRLIEILKSVRLQAVLLFDERRICIDANLPKIKHPWASCHEAGHRVLSWHKPYFFGDTAETLDPSYHERLEEEANYAAGRLLFLGDRFTAEARDVAPTADGIKRLARRYRASVTATLRRYVEQGPYIAMAMLVSTAPWDDPPADQLDRWRHFVPSSGFTRLFPDASADQLRVKVDEHARRRRGGVVGEFSLALPDARGDQHEISAWTFDSHHYLLTLFIEENRMGTKRVVLASDVGF